MEGVRDAGGGQDEGVGQGSSGAKAKNPVNDGRRRECCTFARERWGVVRSGMRIRIGNRA
jgi:hypothetical protein